MTNPTVLSALLLLTSLFINTCSAATELASTSDQSTIIVGAKNPEFKIKLKGNPSSGYLWLLHVYNSNLVIPIKVSTSDNKTTSSASLGASTTQIWEFKVDDQAFAVPTITEMTFVYSRPWEMNNNLSYKDDLTVRIIIDPNYIDKKS